MTGTSKLFGNPTGIPYINTQVDTTVALDLGGLVSVETANGTLKYGDYVFRSVSGRVEKSLEGSPNMTFFGGIVVGGTTTGQAASNDATLIGTNMSATGEKVIVQYTGLCYAACDSTAIIQPGHQIYPGQTTAGRVLGGSTAPSYALNAGGLVIKAGASALAKSALIMATIISGGPGTATAANLDGAAFSGTTANLQYALYVFRVATNGTSVTSAKSADSATLAGLVWPTAGATSVATYGAVLIHPTGTGGFVGGTTALDDATVIPNAVYFDLFTRRSRLGVAISASNGTAGTAFIMQLGAN